MPKGDSIGSDERSGHNPAMARNAPTKAERLARVDECIAYQEQFESAAGVSESRKAAARAKIERLKAERKALLGETERAPRSERPVKVRARLGQDAPIEPPEVDEAAASDIPAVPPE